MTERGDRLYLATDTEVLTSTDRGETWDSLGTHSEGAPRGLAVTDAGFYIAFIEDIFFSEDNQTCVGIVERWLRSREDSGTCLR